MHGERQPTKAGTLPRFSAIRSPSTSRTTDTQSRLSRTMVEKAVRMRPVTASSQMASSRFQ